MRRIAQLLRNQGASLSEVSFVLGYSEGLSVLWRESNDPLLMMRLASALGLDAKASVRLALEGAEAVAFYVGEGEPRPEFARLTVKKFLEGHATADECARAGQCANDAARAYRDVRAAQAAEKRAYRAALHASHAAAKAAYAARDAALAIEFDYDENLTFEDAWVGVRAPCALLAGQALIAAVEAGLAAEAAIATLTRQSAVIGGAVGNEVRPAALDWACDKIRRVAKAEGLDPDGFLS